MRSIARSLLIFTALVSTTAHAHIELAEPTGRYTDQKNGPCGRVGDARTSNVTTLEAGATITVRWTETIDHPGHYRISFDQDGQDSFYVPTSYDDVITDGSDPTILLDDIADKVGGGEYEAQVTLPDVECDNCTLQLIQMMTDKSPYDVTGYFETGNDLYYQCADLVLVRTGGDGDPDGGAGDGDGDGDGGGDEDGDGDGDEAAMGCECARPASSLPASALVVGGLALVVGLRRRRIPGDG